MSSSRDEDRQQALSHHPQQDQVLPATRLSPPGDADAEDNVGSSHTTSAAIQKAGRQGTSTEPPLMPTQPPPDPWNSVGG